MLIARTDIFQRRCMGIVTCVLMGGPRGGQRWLIRDIRYSGVHRRTRQILAEMYIFRIKYELFWTTRWYPKLPESNWNYQKAAETVRCYAEFWYYGQICVRFVQIPPEKISWRDKLGFSRHFLEVQILSKSFRSNQLWPDLIRVGFHWE